MNYTPEQISEIVLKVLKEVNTPDVTKLPLQERKDLASNPNTPPEILTILARDEDEVVRRRVADNPNTPPEILTILARDEDYDVRCRVTENPKAPLGALINICLDNDERFRIQVTSAISNKDETQQKLEELELLKQQAQGKIFDL